MGFDVPPSSTVVPYTGGTDAVVTHLHMISPNTDPPEIISEEVSTTLKTSSDKQLREIINYAQQLIRAQPPLTDAVEARAGEELVRIADHGAYTIAIVERPDESGEARGPFAYRVKWEPNIDTAGGKYRWHYLGQVHDEPGDET